MSLVPKKLLPFVVSVKHKNVMQQIGVPILFICLFFGSGTKKILSLTKGETEEL